MHHRNSHLQLLIALTYPQCILLKVLNQNFPWHITHTLLYRPVYSQWTLGSYTKNCFFLFTPNFDHSSRFDLPTLLCNNFFPSDPHIINRAGVWMSSLCIYLGSFYCTIRFTFLQASSWPWHHSTLNHLVIYRSWGHFRAKTIGTSFKLQY